MRNEKNAIFTAIRAVCRFKVTGALVTMNSEEKKTTGEIPSGMPIGGMPLDGEAFPSERKGKSGGKGAGEASLGHQAKVCFKFGCKLLRGSLGMAVVFLVVALTDVCLSRLPAQLLGTITTAISGGGEESKSAASPSQSGTGEMISPAESQSALKLNYAFWIAVSIGAMLTPFVLKLVTARFDGLQSNALRDQLFKRIIRQAPEFFHENKPGMLTMVLNQMSIETQMTLRQFMLEPIIQVAGLIVSGGLIFANFDAIMAGSSNPWIWVGLGAILLIAVLSPWLSALASTRLATAGMALRGQVADIQTLVTGVVQAPEEIQAMRSESLLEEKHRSALDLLRKAHQRQAVTMEAINSIDEIPLFFVRAGLLGLAIYGGITSGADAGVIAGALVAIILQADGLMAPIQALGSQIVMLRMSWPSVEAVTSMLETPSRTQDSPHAKVIDKVGTTFRVDNLSFSYKPDSPKVFDGISFEVPPGRITGLVAKMGQGKTTLFRLALRFYNPSSGRIEIGGHTPDEFTIESLRSHVVMLSQYPAWFHDTLRENMRLAKSGATDAEIRAVCESTGMWPILEKKIGPRPLDIQFSAGQRLSGGQKKLLALSRCLLNKPQFLFLDEPTTNMDNVEKNKLIPNIKEACADKTTIIVDHDVPWLISVCDYFVVLDEGKVIQQGTAKELMSQGGLFQTLAMLPAKPLMPLFHLLQVEGILDDVVQFRADDATESGK